MRINSAAQEVILKVVYYGPGMAGKTTNLTLIHDRVPSHAAGDLTMVDIHSERTLRFDLLAMDAGDLNGHHVRLEFYTVPGQSYYAATRRAVLAGADGVVFVADSRREALDENIEAMNEMLGNIRHHGLPDDLPLVIQYNKQDLPTALKREQLEPLMNVRNWPSHAAVAVAGDGVMETMQQITALVIDRARRSTEIPAAVTAPASWLISCFRCQAMLEVPEARIGSVYACGICGSALEVVDPDRGLTRPPAAASAATASQQGSGAQRQTNRSPAEDSVYGLQTVEHTPAGGALGVTGGTPLGGMAAGGTPFEIAGYDLVAPLDDTVQGRRFRVRERATGRSLRALILNPTLMRQPGYRENLESHVRMAGQVRHPYILPLAAFTPTQESAALFSIDPPDYEPLGLVLARRRALAPPHAVGIIRQIALGLEEAARHGVVHGWLRPEVVLVSPDGNVLLDEFAVPKQHRYLLRELSGASAATEYYLAPEHLSDEARSDVRTDIFQLGALLFRMLTGEGLVTGYNAHEALHKVAANGARTLRSVQPGISRDLDAFCTRLVAAERKDRFQTYREVIDTLDKFGGGAKRQTLRLTQNIPANQPGTASQMRTGGTAQLRRGGTGQIRRGGTGQIRRGGTGPIPGGLGASAPGLPRRATPFSTPAQYGRTPQGGGSGTGVGLVVMVAAVLGAAIAYFVYNNPASRVTPSSPPPAQLAPTPAPYTPPPTTAVKPTASTPLDAARTPTWMTKGNTPPGNVTPPATPTPPTTVAAQKPPIPSAVDVPAPAPATSPEDRVQIVLRIGEAERAGRFKDALAFCEQLPSAEERQARVLMVGQNHDRMKQDLGVKVAAAKSNATATALLQPLLDGQGLPGDDEWAKSLLAGVQARIGKTPGVAQAPIPTPAPGIPSVQPPVAKVDLDRAAQVDGQVNQALANGQMALANQGLTTLDAATPEAGAIKRKLDLWNRRSEILGRVLTERQPKLRVPHPTTNEMWDIVGFQAGGITVSSAAGSKTDLTWSQVTIKDFARISAEATNSPATKSEEHALATVALLVAGDTVLASVQVKKAKGAIEPALGADLDALIAMQRRRDAVDLVAKAKEAARLGNAKALNDAIDQLKKLDKSLQPLVAEEVAKLEELRGGGIAPPPGTPAAPTAPGTPGTHDKDHVGFDSIDDLKVFEKHGNWQITGGMAVSSGDGARLQRKDLNDVRGLHLIFQPMNSRGSMIVDFRGVRLVVDFAASTYQAISREETLKSKPFAFLPKATCSLYFEVKTGAEVQIDVNNGADTLAIKGGDLTDNLVIACDSASSVALDELTLSRGKPLASKEKQGDLRKLGLEPLGGAYLDAPTIVLAKPMGMTSGIAMVVRDNIAGATFEAKGSGNLRIQLGNPNDRSGQWVDVPLGAIQTAFKVLWTGNQLTVADGAGNALGQVALTSKHTHFMLIALQEAVLMATPKLTYQ